MKSKSEFVICLFLLTLFLGMNIFTFSQSEFKVKQQKQSRVAKAYENNYSDFLQLLRQNNIDSASFNIFIRAFKQEQKLEVWISSSNSVFKLLKTYNFCNSSGNLGPKRKQGDLQIPEGFYYIDRFNPWSSFHLSLGISYPNEFDRFQSGILNPGGDIFIHGDCVTIGCIPISDKWIEELYVILVEARNNGQEKIPVHIFPYQMSLDNIQHYGDKHPGHVFFWKQLKPGYDYFEQKKRIPYIIPSPKGEYVIRE